jgi:putative glutathione S-transferase
MGRGFNLEVQRLAWKDYHRQGAPDLYPVELKQEIDLLNQQIFDDINNGTYKVIFARNARAAKAAYEVYKARLIDFDFRLESRRYLFGDHLTDSNIRLFQTLESYEFTYRPGLVKRLETEDILHIDSLSNIWAYARDLFQTPGFVDEVELYELGYVPFKEEDISWYGEDPDNEDGSLFRVGEYSICWAEDSSTPFGTPVDDSARRKEHYESWLEPSGRGELAGSSAYSGPGGGGSYQLWSIGKNATVYNG